MGETMTLQLYNSYTKKLEEFKPVLDGKVRMYNCGPTVYGYASIGNFRSFILADVLRRYLEWKGLVVEQVMNITDVGHLTDDGDDGEDKLEVAAKKEKKHPLEIAQFYTDAFLADWKALNMLEPQQRPKATEYIKEMIALVQTLLDTGHAYVAEGNVYYDITTFPDYGKLSGNDLEKLGNHRCDIDPNKKHKHDFVLWFGNSKYENHILKWDSPWGEGYPGWHIECSAMSAKLLTDSLKDGAFNSDAFQTIDIHTGGEDNKFPHHECEIAQTTGATNKPFANFWIHGSHLLVEGQRMGKSIGNVKYVFKLIEEGHSPRAIRYLLQSAHYRQKLNFTNDGLVAAQKNIDRIDETLRKLNAIKSDIPYYEHTATQVNMMLHEIEETLDDDLNMSGALGALFEGIRAVNAGLAENKIGEHQAKELLNKFLELDAIFGFIDAGVLDATEIPKEIADLLAERSAARENKDFALSDKIRDELKDKGWEVKDTPHGQEVKKV